MKKMGRASIISYSLKMSVAIGNKKLLSSVKCDQRKETEIKLKAEHLFHFFFFFLKAGHWPKAQLRFQGQQPQALEQNCKYISL